MLFKLLFNKKLAFVMAILFLVATLASCGMFLRKPTTMEEKAKLIVNHFRVLIGAQSTIESCALGLNTAYQTLKGTEKEITRTQYDFWFGTITDAYNAKHKAAIALKDFLMRPAEDLDTTELRSALVDVDSAIGIMLLKVGKYIGFGKVTTAAEKSAMLIQLQKVRAEVSIGKGTMGAEIAGPILTLLLKLAELAFSYGLPLVLDLINKWRITAPSVDDVMAIVNAPPPVPVD